MKVLFFGQRECKIQSFTHSLEKDPDSHNNAHRIWFHWPWFSYARSFCKHIKQKDRIPNPSEHLSSWQKVSLYSMRMSNLCNYYFNFPDLFFFSFLSWLGDELRSFLDVCSCFSAFLAARDDGLGLLESSVLDPLPLTLRYFFSFSVNKNHFVGHLNHEN